MTVDAARGPPDGASDDPVTILVIDDDAAVRRLLRRCLEPAGWAVVEAPNGLVGLGIVEADTPPVDAVLTDLDMPLLDGFEVLAVLAAHRPELPVIVVSASPGDRSRLAHAQATLAKPFPPGALLEAMLPVLQAVRARRTRARQQRADAQESRAIAALQREQAAAMRTRNAGLVAAALALRERRVKGA